MNVVLRRVCKTNIPWKSSKYYILFVCVCVCVLVALRIQHSMRKRHVVICYLPSSAVFFRIISTTRFSRGGDYRTQKLSSDYLYNSVRNISHCKMN